MTKFLKLDEAAQLLGMSPDEVVEARSNGELHGYRDGSSWKFKEEEITRFRAERGAAGGAEDEGDLLQVGDLLGDEEDDAILVSEEELGSSESASSTIIGRGGKQGDGDMDLAAESDLKLASDADTGSDVLGGAPAAPRSAADSDVHLIADLEGSDVKVVPGSSGILGSGSDELKLDLSSGSGSGTGELVDVGGSSDFGLSDDEEVLSLSDEDDLVLASSGTGSDLAMPGSDTGINLASPSDSGLLLEDDALDLGSVSSLELPEDVDDTLDVGSPMRQDDEFNLGPPSAGGAVEDEGSSQVIELGGDDAFAAVPTGDVDPFAATDVFTPIEAGEGLEAVPVQEPALVTVAAPEEHFSAFNIAWLSIMALVLALSGILMIDLVRNMWVWNDGTSQSVASSITEGLISAVGLNR